MSLYSVDCITVYHILLTAVVGYLGFAYYKNFHYPRHIGPLKSIPGPSNELLLTIKFLYARLTGNPAKFYKDLHAEYGPICHSGMGVIAISDPESTKIIYSSYRFKKDYSYELCYENVQNIFSTCDRSYHSIRKRMISPAFNWKSIIQLEPQISLHVVDNTITAINECLDNGCNQVDVYELFHKSIADAISDLVIGRCFNSLKNPNFPAYKISSHIADSWGLKSTVSGLDFIKSRHHPIINQNITKELKERRAGKYRKDILQTLVDAKDTETNSTFNDVEIIEEASALIFAGMETTAVAIIWTFYLLGKNPQAYKKLVEELIVTFPDKNTKISYDMCKDLPYLTAVIHESLRIKSPAGVILPRVVPEGGATICGHSIPEGTLIASSANGIHLSEKNFKDSESFIPERWVDPDAEKLKDMLFIFGLGPRGCVGKNLAWLEMYISLANVIRQFDFSMPESTQLTGFDLFVLKGKEEKLLLNATPRSS
ncbi:cytochrome P450 [Conidiobolus coronatus NRRL 28638]|uniref:Cytochrome P450 n=1 Tax=Conidiobolus coronatus (strain ATCC 28846 / CBS 209.66 / NRRL 28638) TaxID=796925 RepID=A0A137PGZ6_CONC2|nr:cytochrome P450 [Conidiobolus coronatus NRRL 28638]|eukprot:KXN74273.1 cytochrome P450 [Conidiobolus coronatus NRRL 28638]